MPRNSCCPTRTLGSHRRATNCGIEQEISGQFEGFEESFESIQIKTILGVGTEIRSKAL
jgi:hypothetical protein